MDKTVEREAVLDAQNSSVCRWCGDKTYGYVSLDGLCESCNENGANWKTFDVLPLLDLLKPFADEYEEGFKHWGWWDYHLHGDVVPGMFFCRVSDFKKLYDFYQGLKA